MTEQASRHPLDASRELVDRTSPTVRADLLLVPLGSTEQHGPHLPLDTDTSVAVAVARRVADRVPGALVGPAIPYGSSGEHQDFPGTLSIGTVALEHVLVELGRSATTWVPRVVFVNGHGGNLDALIPAVRLLRAEGRDASWLPCDPADGRARDAHAGRDETSLLARLRPEAVRSDRAEAGATAPLAELLPALRSGGVRAVAGNGVLGDPTGATADEGAELLEAMTAAAVRLVEVGTVGADGRLRGERRDG